MVGKIQKKAGFRWTMREQHEIKEHHRRFAKDLMELLEKRVNSILHSETISNLEVFDATHLINLPCGTAKDGKIEFFLPEGEREEYGVKECKKVMKVASKLSPIQASVLNFDARMAHAYMGLLKKAVLEGVWNGICMDWFDVIDDIEGNLFITGASLQEIRAEKSTNLESTFVMHFSNGTVRKVKLSEKCVYKSFYSNKVLYEIAQPLNMCPFGHCLGKRWPQSNSRKLLQCHAQPTTVR